MATAYTLTRAERLRSLKVIRRLFDEGRSGFTYPFRYFWLVDKCEMAGGEVVSGVASDEEAATTDEGANMASLSGAVAPSMSGVEVMFSVPKRFLKRANKRNLVRRRTKESYRLTKGELVARCGDRRVHIALIYSTKKIHEYKTINYAIERILGEIGNNL